MNKVLPTIGMGATVQHHSDRTACTIVQVSSGFKRIVLREDKAIRTDNNAMSESQSYNYESDPNGKIYIATLRKTGQYCLVGSKRIVSLGVRHQFHDYSF